MGIDIDSKLINGDFHIVDSDEFRAYNLLVDSQTILVEHPSIESINGEDEDDENDEIIGECEFLPQDLEDLMVFETKGLSEDGKNMKRFIEGEIQEQINIHIKKNPFISITDIQIKQEEILKGFIETLKNYTEDEFKKFCHDVKKLTDKKVSLIKKPKFPENENIGLNLAKIIQSGADNTQIEMIVNNYLSDFLVKYQYIDVFFKPKKGEVVINVYF